MVSEHGFKTLTVENWQKPDPILQDFVQIRAGGTVASMKGNDWADEILKIDLAEVVPEPVRALFRVARGAIVYGYFFYPLYTLGLEHVYRTAEAAIRAKCSIMGNDGKQRFADRVRWLAQHGVLSAHDEEIWNHYREMRNHVSHPERPMIVTPGMSIRTVRHVADNITRLFADPSP